MDLVCAKNLITAPSPPRPPASPPRMPGGNLRSVIPFTIADNDKPDVKASQQQLYYNDSHS
jgi:hypothetical protein